MCLLLFLFCDLIQIQTDILPMYTKCHTIHVPHFWQIHHGWWSSSYFEQSGWDEYQTNRCVLATIIMSVVCMIFFLLSFFLLSLQMALWMGTSCTTGISPFELSRCTFCEKVSLWRPPPPIHLGNTYSVVFERKAAQFRLSSHPMRGFWWISQ